MTELDDEVLAGIIEIFEDEDVVIDAVYDPLENNYDVADGSNTQTSTTTAIKITPPARFKEYLVNGDTILATDLQVITRTEVQAPGKINNWTIVSVWPLVSGTQTHAWKVQLRA